MARTTVPHILKLRVERILRLGTTKVEYVEGDPNLFKATLANGDVKYVNVLTRKEVRGVAETTDQKSSKKSTSDDNAAMISRDDVEAAPKKKSTRKKSSTTSATRKKATKKS